MLNLLVYHVTSWLVKVNKGQFSDTIQNQVTQLPNNLFFLISILLLPKRKMENDIKIELKK